MIVLQVPSTTWVLQSLCDEEPDLRSRALEWRGVAIPLEGAEYVALKTDWLPRSDDLKPTPSGARLLLGGNWPKEIQERIEGGAWVRISPNALKEIWGVLRTAPALVEINGRPVPQEMAERIRDSLCVLSLHDAGGLTEMDVLQPFVGTRFSIARDAARFWVFCPGFEGRVDVTDPATGAVIGMFLRTTDLPRVCSDVEGEEVREVAIQDLWFLGDGIASCGLSGENDDKETCDNGPAVGDATREEPSAIPLHVIDAWSWGRVVTAIRQRAEIYPEPIPDPNDISEAESRALLRTMLQHPAVIEEERRRSEEYAIQNEQARDIRTRQYAIDVGVSLPDPTPPPMAQEFDCTDDGNGSRLIAQYRDSIRYCEPYKAWFLWDGGRWERDETRRMLALAKRVARTIYIEAMNAPGERAEKIGKWAVRSGMLSRLKAMIESASPIVAIVPDDLDAHPTLLNCQNCTLDLETLSPREPRREDLLTMMAGVAYDPDAECPQWLAHLDLIFGGDAEIIDGFQQMAGYSLLDGNPEQVMFILFGRGKNGKSVTMKVLSEVLGDYAVNIAAESLMVRRIEGARSDLARLKGARMATSSEGDEGAKLAEGIVKQLTGNDDTITVRRLYENEFEFTPGAKIWLGTNHEPKIRGTDDGIWRRIWLIPFEVQISEDRRDPRITEKLLEERAGILNWMLAGLRKYYEQGGRLQPPEKVVAATRQYRQESDILGRALDDELVCGGVAKGRTLARKEVTNGLRAWFEEQGERMPSPQKVARALRERGVADGPVMSGTRHWLHVRWKTDEEKENDGIGA